MLQQKNPLERVYSFFKNYQFIIETIIFGAFAIIIVIIFSIYQQVPFKPESLLLAVLIFGIYLVVSGKVTELGFMDFTVKIRDAETKPTEIESQEASVFNVAVGKELTPAEDTIKATTPEASAATESGTSAEMINEEGKHQVNEKIKILYILRDLYIYQKGPLLDYLEGRDYVVFLEDAIILKEEGQKKKPIPKLEDNRPKGRLSGFALATDLVKKLHTSDGEKFVEVINKWDFNTDISSKIIRTDAYIVKGTTRKQVLKIMQNEKLDVLPVVSANLYYEGIIDRNTIIYQIFKDLSKFSSVFEELSKS
ncbi:MAG: hypothetical protein M3297_14310 [Thermoproteota archaeon]|nr:hypothetical protein [Thermoproteota archaeon]